MPTFFTEPEHDEFAAFLDALPGPYDVIIRRGEIVGCGGIALDPNGEVRLCWGMIDRRYHRQGLGQLLLDHRIAAARKLPGAKRIGLHTSQHTKGFYARSGFEVIAVTRDGYAPGLDRCDMALAW